MSDVDFSVKFGFSFKQVMAVLALAGLLTLGGAFLLQPTPDTQEVPFVETEYIEYVVPCDESQPTPPVGCVWALSCED